MNDRFLAEQRGTQVYDGLLFLAGGLVFTLVPSFALLSLLQARDLKPLDPMQVLGLVGGLTAGLVVGFGTARYLLWQLAYEVRIESDGNLVFVSPLARFRGSIQEIVSIERANGGLIRGFDPRELRIKHQQGVARLHYLEETEAFILRVENANPRITIKGTWG